MQTHSNIYILTSMYNLKKLPLSSKAESIISQSITLGLYFLYLLSDSFFNALSKNIFTGFIPYSEIIQLCLYLGFISILYYLIMSSTFYLIFRIFTYDPKDFSSKVNLNSQRRRLHHSHYEPHTEYMVHTSSNDEDSTSKCP